MSERSPQLRTASATTRQFFGARSLGDIRVGDRQESGIHINTFYGWKSGKAAATVVNIEAALSVIGVLWLFILFPANDG